MQGFNKKVPVYNGIFDTFYKIYKTEGFFALYSGFLVAQIRIFPCLAIPMGNIQDQSIKDIMLGKEFKKFKDVMKKHGTVEACNRCGWLQPN